MEENFDPESIVIKIKRDSKPLDLQDINHIYRSHIYETKTNKEYSSAVPSGHTNEREVFISGLQVTGPYLRVKQYLELRGLSITGKNYETKN